MNKKTVIILGIIGAIILIIIAGIIWYSTGIKPEKNISLLLYHKIL